MNYPTVITAMVAFILSAGMALPAHAQAKIADDVTDKKMGEGIDETRPSRIDAATAFATSLMEKASTALSTEGVSKDAQLKLFEDVLSDGLALEAIGKFLLGDAKTSITQEQLALYNRRFPAYITRQYAEQFADIIGKKLTIVDAKELGRRDIIVRSQIERANGSPVNIDWRIRTVRSGEMKAVDIIVSGVSVMLVKREEFTAYIAANGIDALLDTMAIEPGIN